MKLLDLLLCLVIVAVASILFTAILTWSVDLWVLLTRLGDEEFYLVAGVFAYFLLGDPVSGFALVSSVVLSGSLSIFLKYLFNTPRPPNPIIEASGPGFPSGHAMVSTSFWSTLSLVTGRRLVYILSTLVVASISASRIALRAHYYWDVLGGVLYGFIVGGLAYYARLHCNTRPPVKPMALLILPSIILGFYNVFIRGVELAASTGLFGLGISLFASILTPSAPVCRVIGGFWRRVFAFTLSSILLLCVYFAARTTGVFVGVVLYALAGFTVFSIIPFLLSRLRFS